MGTYPKDGLGVFRRRRSSLSGVLAPNPFEPPAGWIIQPIAPEVSLNLTSSSFSPARDAGLPTEEGPAFDHCPPIRHRLSGLGTRQNRYLRRGWTRRRRCSSMAVLSVSERHLQGIRQMVPVRDIEAWVCLDRRRWRYGRAEELPGCLAAPALRDDPIGALTIPFPPGTVSARIWGSSG